MNLLSHCQSFPIASFEAGEVLIREGDDARKLFVLRSGSVTVTKAGVRIAEVDQPGALFGEMSALLDVPYTAEVTANVASQAHVIDDAQSFLTSEPALALQVAQLLAKRLYDANRFVAGQHAAGPSTQDSDALLGLIFQQADPA